MKTELMAFTTGKEDLLNGEKNDCSVRALANSTGMSYCKAHFLLDRAGRKDQTAMCSVTLAKFYCTMGFSVEFFGNTKQTQYLLWMHNRTLDTRINLKSSTLRTMLASGKYNEGKFIFGTKDHVFAVVNGCIIDDGYNLSTVRIVEVFTLKGNV